MDNLQDLKLDSHSNIVSGYSSSRNAGMRVFGLDAWLYSGIHAVSMTKQEKTLWPSSGHTFKRNVIRGVCATERQAANDLRDMLWAALLHFAKLSILLVWRPTTFETI